MVLVLKVFTSKKWHIVPEGIEMRPVRCARSPGIFVTYSTWAYKRRIAREGLQVENACENYRPHRL